MRRRFVPWALVLLAVIGYPVAAVSGGTPHFPKRSDCVDLATKDGEIEAVFGRFDRRADAAARLELVLGRGFKGSEVEGDGCGRMKVVPALAGRRSGTVRRGRGRACSRARRRRRGRRARAVPPLRDRVRPRHAREPAAATLARAARPGAACELRPRCAACRRRSLARALASRRLGRGEERQALCRAGVGDGRGACAASAVACAPCSAPGEARDRRVERPRRARARCSARVRCA